MKAEKKQFRTFPLLLFLFFLTACGREGMTLHTAGEETEEAAILMEEISGGKTEAAEEVVVYICGAVEQEGVYSLPAGSRVNDALEAAGGLKAEAAEGYVNLAEPLTDGAKIRFPTKDEAEDEGLSPAEGLTEMPEDGRVNINTATREELMTLPGIGEKKADDILDYRRRVGAFQDIEELKNISGIKDGVFNKLKDHVKIN